MPFALRVARKVLCDFESQMQGSKWTVSSTPGYFLFLL